MRNRKPIVPLKRLLGTAWIIGTAAAGVAPIVLGTAPALAQEVESASADMGGSDIASPDGSYLRFELGAAKPSAGDANWLPADFPESPQIFFDLDLDTTAMGAIAIGYSYGNGWRAEAALNIFGTSDFAGPWSYTVPADPGPHAGVEGSVRSTAILANGYYDFATRAGATPFLTAGIGFAHNSMDEWARISPNPARPPRVYESNSETDLAWSIGAGVALDVGSVFGSGPAKVELAWRYFDLGSITGGATPVPGSGTVEEPVEALNFDLTEQVISIGLRIPL